MLEVNVDRGRRGTFYWGKLSQKSRLDDWSVSTAGYFWRPSNCPTSLLSIIYMLRGKQRMRTPNIRGSNRPCGRGEFISLLDFIVMHVQTHVVD